ncbi:hypothetical protein M758_3G226500 [Ceratodon purpureus]|nr:hypothetical protein M758_3G226500 [Ceratodon purpureus]
MNINGSGALGDGNGLHDEGEIVIVGGGIGGLSCALALHRAGIKAVVLEQSDTLRAWGAGITLWNNAFSVLDVLGLGDRFRSMYINLLAWETLNSQGEVLAKVKFADCEGGPHDLRAVDRKVILEVLAGELPEGTIRFSSGVIGIKKSESRTGITELELQDGSTYSAKVVLGFDGINSYVASWLGLPKPQPVGHIGIRGMAVFPEGHKLDYTVRLFVGKGCRAAYIPASPTNVSWFFVWNDSPEGTNGQQMSKAEAMQHASTSFPPTLLSSIIDNTPQEKFFKYAIRHRLNTNGPEPLVNGTITVAGDAAHPCTPNMGQGGCMALEDGLILARKLHDALRPPPNTDQDMLKLPEHERIHRALVEFQYERHDRTNFISTRSYRIGRMIHTGWTVLDYFRDRFMIPLIVNKNKLLAHTLFDVGKLPGQSS